MSNSGRLRTITVSWRKVCVALPALALIGGGIAQSAPITPVSSINGVDIANDSSAIVVPDIALTLPGPARILPGDLS